MHEDDTDRDASLNNASTGLEAVFGAAQATILRESMATMHDDGVSKKERNAAKKTVKEMMKRKKEQLKAKYETLKERKEEMYETLREIFRPLQYGGMTPRLAYEVIDASDATTAPYTYSEESYIGIEGAPGKVLSMRVIAERPDDPKKAKKMSDLIHREKEKREKTLKHMQKT